MTLSSLKEYGLEYQTKVIHSLLKNRIFLLNIRDIIELEYFTHPGQYWIVNQLLKYYDSYNIAPTLDYFKIEVKKIENKVLQTSVKDQLKTIYSMINTDQEYVESEFNNFCINQKLKKALLESVDHLGRGDFEKIRVTIENALKAGQDKEIGLDYIKDIERRYQSDERKPIPTPWSEVNRMLQGGLGGGDLGLIFGNPGGGKSWCLVAIGALALILGYKVIHYTLELGESYVGKRYDANLTNINVSEIGNHKDELINFLKKYENNLIIKEYPPKSATMGTIKSHYQKCRDLGFDADLILIDYIDILKPSLRRTSKKEELDDLYYDAKGLAKELNLPIWSVSQLNRSAAREEVVEGDRSAGSYDKIMIADFAMSIARTRKDKVNGTARWHVVKSRYNADGITWNVVLDLGVGKFEIIGEYDDEEEYKSENKKIHQDEISNKEKELMLSKFKSFKIE